MHGRAGNATTFNIELMVLTEVCIFLTKSMLPVTSQGVNTSQGAYFQYEIHTSAFSAFKFVLFPLQWRIGEGFRGSEPPLSALKITIQIG